MEDSHTRFILAYLLEHAHIGLLLGLLISDCMKCSLAMAIIRTQVCLRLL